MNDDLISRAAAIDLFPNDVLEWDTLDGYIAPHVARRLIEDLPSAQQEIIRCRDCKHYIPYDWMFSGLSRSSNINNYSSDDMVCLVNDDNYPPDGFCSKAERKNDEAD
jgi:hypothetical protein